ncbi:MAG: HNH endonuclease [Sulfobacillus sp.]
MRDLRYRVFRRDGFRCCECGIPQTLQSGHLAHIVSRGAGGEDTEENTRLLCWKCHAAAHHPKSCPAKSPKP